MKSNRFRRLLLVAATAGVIAPIGESFAETSPKSLAERGKYLVTIAGCNDCHTPNFMLSEGETPESEWLTGDSFGWRGPWGTTYASNLRLLVQNLGEAEWVVFAKNLKARPPMPWFNLNKMSDDDLRAIYQFARGLGPGGTPAPAFVPPGEEPNPPYALFPSPPE